MKISTTITMYILLYNFLPTTSKEELLIFTQFHIYHYVNREGNPTAQEICLLNMNFNMKYNVFIIVLCIVLEENNIYI